jgi:hypothetical protein
VREALSEDARDIPVYQHRAPSGIPPLLGKGKAPHDVTGADCRAGIRTDQEIVGSGH